MDFNWYPAGEFCCVTPTFGLKLLGFMIKAAKLLLPLTVTSFLPANTKKAVGNLFPD